MQIREIDLKELYTVYGIISHLYPNISYKEFEDLIYDMRYMEYKMIGIFEKGELVSYAGVAIQTTIKDKRHLKVFDIVTAPFYNFSKYDKFMKEYLEDYSRMAMCKSVIF